MLSALLQHKDIQALPLQWRGKRYLMSAGSEAQTQLSAHHHGFINGPVLTADGTPTLATAHLHQNLHAALRWNSATGKPYLRIRENEGIKLGLDQSKRGNE